LVAWARSDRPFVTFAKAEAEGIDWKSVPGAGVDLMQTSSLTFKKKPRMTNKLLPILYFTKRSEEVLRKSNKQM